MVPTFKDVSQTTLHHSCIPGPWLILHCVLAFTHFCPFMPSLHPCHLQFTISFYSDFLLYCVHVLHTSSNVTGIDADQSHYSLINLQLKCKTLVQALLLNMMQQRQYLPFMSLSRENLCSLHLRVKHLYGHHLSQVCRM